jgi:hypothetical protein
MREQSKEGHSLYCMPLVRFGLLHKKCEHSFANIKGFTVKAKAQARAIVSRLTSSAFKSHCGLKGGLLCHFTICVAPHAGRNTTFTPQWPKSRRTGSLAQIAETATLRRCISLVLCSSKAQAR